ncbi:putative gustatory receptor 2a [Coccinella septempunctata]|uniref:putative gustatory receptor 2a n=1 Tax=Coccinella septempunctata TaxID=41139 RepID=UPI001D08E98C|nr:putative gustatory receptor 2a [Coccinella septempunctata]
MGHVYIDVIFLTLTFYAADALCLWVFYTNSKSILYINIARVYYWYMIILVYLTVTRIRNGLKKLHAYLEAISPPKIEHVESRVHVIQPFNSFSRFMKYYRTIYDAVQIFNDIFGYHMVFLNLNCILEWLSALNRIISSIKNNNLQIDIIMVVFLQSTIILIGIIFIILLCSSVTNEAEHFLYVLHQIEDYNHNLKAKCIVIQLVEDMPIHFSAARFFNISKYTILGIIGNCTTYFIVLIQFYQ